MNCQIDGMSLPVVQPESIGDMCQVVRDAAADGQAIYPVGGRTMLEIGRPPAREGIALETIRLDRVIDYPSRDMTITVEAGTRVAKLQELLWSERQRLPVDVPRAAEATLGGAIATNMSGPRRYGCGTLRDYVIGITVVDTAGNETKAGGRVVKNVAGYDLCKLYTGSLGTLGVISQVTLKLRPLPESIAAAWISSDDGDTVSQALERLACSRTRPAAIELLNSAAASRIAQTCPATITIPVAQWILTVIFEETSDAVRWQQNQLSAELHDLNLTTLWCDSAQALALSNALVEFQVSSASLSFKANLRSSAVIELFKIVKRQTGEWAVEAHAGNGIAYGHLTNAGDVDAVAKSLAELRAFTVSQQGNLVLYRCPTDWKTRLPVWGEPRRDAWLMKAIQRKLNPTDVWNAGRFLDFDL